MKKTTLLNYEGEVIERFDSIKNALLYKNGKSSKLTSPRLNNLNNKKAIGFYGDFLILTKFEENYIPHVSQKDGIKKSSKYLKRKKYMKCRWKNTIFVVNNDLEILKVYSELGVLKKIAKDESVSVGTIKSYINRAVKFIDSGSKRKKFFLRRKDYLSKSR